MIGEANASQARAQEELIKQAEELDESQKKITVTLLDQHKILVDNTVDQAQYAREAEHQVQLSENSIIKNNIGNKEDNPKTVKFLLDEMTSEYSKAGPLVVCSLIYLEILVNLSLLLKIMLKKLMII